MLPLSEKMCLINYLHINGIGLCPLDTLRVVSLSAPLKLFAPEWRLLKYTNLSHLRNISNNITGGCPSCSQCNQDPAGFQFRCISANGFRSNVFHQHADVLQVFAKHRRWNFLTEIRWHRTRERFAVGDVELDAVHGTCKVCTIERTLFERRIHVAAAPLDSVVLSTAVADNDLISVEFDGFHPAGCDFTGAYRPDELFSQDLPPSATIGATWKGRGHPCARTARTNSA